MRKLIYLFVVVAMVGGCATVPTFNNISLGMTKQEVIGALGSPYSISAQGNVEYLTYVSHLGLIQTEYNITGRYFVRLVNGKVESYGKVGDFDSTKNPTNDVNLNINQGR